MVRDFSSVVAINIILWLCVVCVYIENEFWEKWEPQIEDIVVNCYAKPTSWDSMTTNQNLNSSGHALIFLAHHSPRYIALNYTHSIPSRFLLIYITFNTNMLLNSFGQARFWLLVVVENKSHANTLSKMVHFL